MAKKTIKTSSKAGARRKAKKQEARKGGKARRHEDAVIHQDVSFTEAS